MNLSEFIVNFSREYSVHHVNDVDSRVCVKEIKQDICLVKNELDEVKLV